MFGLRLLESLCKQQQPATDCCDGQMGHGNRVGTAAFPLPHGSNMSRGYCNVTGF